MKMMTTTRLGEATYPSPCPFSVADDLMMPAQLEGPSGQLPVELFLF